MNIRDKSGRNMRDYLAEFDTLFKMRNFMGALLAEKLQQMIILVSLIDVRSYYEPVST